MPKAHEMYKVDKSGKITRSKKSCPRCEKGTFMAEHFDRFSCVDVDIPSSKERVSSGHSPTMAITHLTKMRIPIIIVRTTSTRNTPGI